MKWRAWYWLLTPFTMPIVVATLVIGLAFYRVDVWRWRDQCLEFVAGRLPNGQTRIWGRPGGQSWGCQVIWYSSERQWDDPGLRVHERVHALHGLWGLGIPFALAYGIHFLFRLARYRNWRVAYRGVWSERAAYRMESQYRNGRRGMWGE